MNYVVVYSETLPNLVEKVNGRLQGGFECVGGIAVTTSQGNCESYYQAMIFKGD